MSEPLHRAPNFESWHVEWQRTAARIDALAEHALQARTPYQRRPRVPAGEQLLSHRKFFLAPDDVRRLPTFEKSRTTFRRFLELAEILIERVSIPYEGTTLPGYLYRVDDSGVPRRTLVSIGGFDSTGEELYFFAAAAALHRGYNVLTFAGPGQGEPLRVQRLPARRRSRLVSRR